MQRFLMVLALGALLAACTGTGTDTESQDIDIGSVPAETSPEPIMSDDMDDMSESPDASASMDDDDMSASCDDAFDALAVEDVDSLDDLAAMSDEVEATIDACVSVDEWVEAAETALPDVDLSEAEDFLETRCATDSTLAETAICQEVAS